MGKRSRAKALAEGSASENSSKQTSPVPSDSDDNESTPPPKRSKTENGGKKGPKSSAEICEQYGLTDVRLEYTVADYQNLTNYGLFVRMVRPQVAANNSKITSSRMVQLMEAKWREFRESNPLIKQKESSSSKRLSSELKSSDKKKSKESKKKKALEKKSKKKVVLSSDEDTDKTEEESEQEEDRDEEEEEEEVEPDPEPEPEPKRKSGGLKIRLPIPKSLSAKKSKKDTPKSGSSKRKGAAYESEEESPYSSRRSSRVATPIFRQSDTNEESSVDENDCEGEPPIKQSRSSSRPKRQSRGSTKKVVQEDDSSAEEQVDSDDDYEASSRNKRSRASKSKQKKKKPVEDEDFEEEEEEDDGDEDIESDEETQKKSSKQKPVIPGERKSERSRRSAPSVNMMSDKEFEKMLKEEATVKKQTKRQKEKEAKEAKRKKEVAKSIKGRKGYWQEGEEEKNGSGAEEKDGIDKTDEHYWYCEACKDGGDLLLCDTCPKSWHKECAKIEGEIPDGDWSCPKCKGTYESEEEDDHDIYCKVCKDGGDVLLCDFCNNVYHPKCCNPPLIDIPEGEWKCPRCVCADQPLKAKIKRILFWRWSHQISGTDETDHTQSPQKKAIAQAAEAVQKEKEAQGEVPVKRPERQFLCRFEYHSYWDIEWLSELQLEVHAAIQFHGFKRKWDMDEPPGLEDGSSWGKQRRKKDRTEEDPHNLEEKYYRYGIKPEWLQIHRIINHEGREGKSNTRYLVKWRDLEYADCTWETPSDLPDGLEDWQKHYNFYWDTRKEKMKPTKDKKKPKKADLKKKWEKQPDYISATGGTLHAYQLEGLNWMRFSWAQDTNVILADEMGLGKTIQAITMLYTLWKEGYSKGPFLISAPLSTVPNWEREFDFWAPDMYVITYIGGKEGRAVMREHEFSYDEDPFHYYAKAAKMRSGARTKFDVCLTSYEMVNMDRATLSSISWEMLVVDEAHRLKSQQSLFFQTLTKYKIAFKLLLTGTPLQNNLEELFNLLNFLEPGKFVDMNDFLGQFDDINKEQQVTRLHEMLAPHMLRRLKADVLTDLPSKSEFIVRIELAPMQKKFYKHILTKNYEALNVKGYSNQTSLMNIMIDLRKCCNHPYLFPAAEKDAPIAPNGMYEGNALIKACGKMELMSKMLKQLKKDNHRVLIFSQMTRALDILEDFMVHEGYGYERIDGSITGKLRQESIDRFNNKESKSFVFLLSTKAGGLGINLATADTVIIYDMDWNPHNDIQALSRAHRIGQQNKVLIYRFVSRNTVEERMTEVAKKKMMLTELVIHRGMGSEKQESLSKKEVSDILKFGAEELFKDNEEGSVVWTDDAVSKLLDRTQAGDEQPEESAAAMGLNEYLRSFKVASYHVKEGTKDEEEEEEDQEEEEEPQEQEQDSEYWRRVLGESYTEHKVQLIQQQEEIARSLGKGKRVRRQVNYAELQMHKDNVREQQEKEPKDKKGKKMIGELEEEEEDQIEEEAKYMSDYDPEEDESSEEEEDEEAIPAKSDDNDEDWNDGKTPKDEPKKRGRPEKVAPKVDTNVLPPLLAKVNGHTEVLGFTARQRRAFLDAVMRYGMPPEDCHQSQWLVRDLRNKTEKVFRAYVSLFMRHLCEAVSDDAEKFSDGVPREGLSRQHVLTRIGIIALIRRKVQEFEERNGTDSMFEFKKKKVTVQVTAAATAKPTAIESSVKSEEKAPVKDEDESKETKVTDVKEENGETGKPPEKESKDKDAKEDSLKEAKIEPKEEIKEESQQEDKGSDEKAMEVDEDNDSKDDKLSVKKDQKPLVKTEDIPQLDGTGDDKESSTAGSSAGDEEKEGEKDARKDEKESKEEEKSEKAKEVEGDSEVGDDSEEEEDKVLSDKDGEEQQRSEKKKEERTDTHTKEEKTGEHKEEKTDEDKEEKVDRDQIEKDNKTEDMKDEAKQKPKEKEEKNNTEKKPEAKDSNEEKSKEVKKTDEKSEKDKNLKIVVDPRRQAWELRRIFYIADGGFTELHALWQYEEQQLKPGREFETWHRRHDYWLLAGIITHGYRHWQDILNDPRFEMLNRAFQSDAEKMRKAAFLNRRFQLLEQALVIEEQLHKAILQSADLQAQLRKNCRGEIDPYSELDQLAILLRQIARRGATQDPHLAKVLAQLESLVGDIKHSTNSVVPATLARAPGVVIRQQAPARPQAMARPIRPATQVVLPRHVMEQQRRNTPSPQNKNPTVITLE